jgi:transposase InsO family protein
LTVRTDWGPQYTAQAFGAELRWLGIQHSPAFVDEPQFNGMIERFMRTLKEQCAVRVLSVNSRRLLPKATKSAPATDVKFSAVTGAPRSLLPSPADYEAVEDSICFASGVCEACSIHWEASSAIPLRSRLQRPAQLWSTRDGKQPCRAGRGL